MYTPRSALEPVLTAVYAALNTAGLTGLAPVYNNVPEGVKPPYVIVQTPTENPWNTFGAPGSDVVVPVECVSVQPSALEVVRLANAVRQLLDRAELSGTSGYAVASCRFESSVPDEDVIDGVRYRYLTSLFRVTLGQTS